MKENLSTTTSITSTYAGEFAGQYIQAMLLASKTLGDGLITIKPNIAYKQVVKKLATASLLQDAACDFTATGTVTLTERILEPKQIMVNLQLCKKDFISDWESINMGYSSFKNLPKNFSDFLIGNISASVGASIETSIWQGITGVTGTFEGFCYKFKADSDVNDISGTTITSSNVQAELAKVVAKLATLKIFNQGEKPIIYCATDVISNYLISLGGYSASGVGANGYKGEGPNQIYPQKLYFAGIELVEAPGLATSEMVGAQPDNLWFGTGLMSDHNKVQVLDMADLDGSDNVRFISRFSAGVQYGIGEEIVYYWIY
jgi:hypothetical protein